MKKLLIGIGILVVVIISTLYLDLRLTHGFWIDMFYLEKNFGYDFEHKRIEADNSVEYTVEVNESGSYLLSFRNKSIVPKYFLAYRDSIYFNMTDTNFFHYSTRCSIQLPDTTVNNGWSSLGCCGTGIENVSINPFEHFQIEKTEKELFDSFLVYTLLSYQKDSCYYELLDDELLYCSDRDYNMNWVSQKTRSKIDTVEIQFYLPVYSYFTGDESFVYSNKLRVSYSDLISNFQERVESGSFY